MRAAARVRPTGVVLPGVLVAGEPVRPVRRVGHLAVRRTSVLVALLVALVAVPSAAWAFWSAGAVGAGTATTGTLAAPTDVRAAATGTDVTITWASPTRSYPAPTLGYEATDDRGNTVCSAASPTATSCSYTAYTGTFRYAVTAVLGSWTATSDVSDELTVGTIPAGVDASAGSSRSADQAADLTAPSGDGAAVAAPDGGTVTGTASAVTAAAVAITSAPATGSASSTADVGAITVGLQDASGASVEAAVSTTVSLSSNSTGTAVFAATRSGPAVTSVTIPSGSSSVSFFYGDTRAGSPTVTAAVVGLPVAAQVETVTPATAQSLTFTAQPPVSVSVNEDFTVAVQAFDRFGNPAPVSLAMDEQDTMSGATLRGSLARVPDAHGVTTFAGLAIDTAGTFTLRAGSGTATVVSTALTAMAP